VGTSGRPQCQLRTNGRPLTAAARDAADPLIWTVTVWRMSPLETGRTVNRWPATCPAKLDSAERARVPLALALGQSTVRWTHSPRPLPSRRWSARHEAPSPLRYVRCNRPDGTSLGGPPVRHGLPPAFLIAEEGIPLGKVKARKDNQRRSVSTRGVGFMSSS
jgi:hypothetical protein